MSIYFTNDFHSNVPNSSNLLNTLAKIKKTNHDLLVDLGDFTEGSAFYLQFKGKPEVKIVTNLYDLAIPGNHGFGEILQMWENGFTVLCSNMYFKKKLFFNESYIHKDISTTFVLLGIISPEAFNSIEADKRKNYEVVDPIAVLPTLIQKYKKNNTKIILLSHSGFEYDMKLAKVVSGIDVIISSHCHSKYRKSVVNGTQIVKAYEEGHGYGKLAAIKDQIKVTLYRLPVSETVFESPLSFLNKKIEKYNAKLSAVILDKNHISKIQHISRKQMTKNFIKYLKLHFKIDMVILNYNMFRSSLQKDILTLKDIFNYCPFDNSLTITEIDKNKLLKNLSDIPEDVKEYMYFSSPFSEMKSKIYFLTTSYLADNFLAHLSKKSYNTGLKVRETFIDYLRNTYST